MERHRQVVIGIDLAKKVDRTCIAVTEQLGREFVCGDLGRLPQGLDYGEQARRIGRTYHQTVAVVAAANEKDARRARGGFFRAPYMDPPAGIDAAASVWVIIDASGVGEAVIDGVREYCGIPESHVLGIQITGGVAHKFALGAQNGSVSKQFLISQLRRLTGFDPPLLKLPRGSEAKALRQELEVFEYNITDSAHPQWGAKQGQHDDMIIALALSTLPGALPVYHGGSESYIDRSLITNRIEE